MQMPLSRPGPQVLAAGLAFPESPRLRDDELWFVDGPTLKVLAPDGAVRTHCRIDCPLLIGISFTPEGDALVSDPVGRRVFRVGATGAVSLFADLAAFTPYFINEAMMLADGSVIVDDVGYDFMAGAAPAAARLIRIAADGTVGRTGAPLAFANGLVALDGGTGLLVAEHGGSRIWRFRLQADAGLDDGTVVCTVPTDGLDGIATAPDGSIWYADARSGALVQMAADGTALRGIMSGYAIATSCVLNASGTRLYATVVDTMPGKDFVFAGDGAIVAFDLDPPPATGTAARVTPR